MIKTEYLVPIHVGKSISKVTLEDTIGDNTGRNISHKNGSWCELTALYWMRHNVEAEYYGLMHYRRLLNFSEGAEGVKTFDSISEQKLEKFGWNDKRIAEACANFDIITSPVWNVHPVGAGHILMSNYDMYAREHFSKDMDVVERLIKEHSPAVYPFMVQTMISRSCFFGNITIMRKAYFQEYCDWLFQILDKAEEEIDISKYDAYQRRIWGFIAERLTNVYVNYARAVHQPKIASLPLVMGIYPRAPVLSDELLTKARNIRDRVKVSEGTKGDAESINVVLAFDENYAPHAAVTISSALAVSADPRRVKFFILESGKISTASKAHLTSIVERRGSSIEFIYVDERELQWLPLNRDHISIATYYRLVMHRLLPETVEKVIYLDADTIVVEPIENLWDTSLDGMPLGACCDEGGVLQTRRLQLPLTHKYFNAGVLVFDLRQIRKMNLSEESLKAFRTHGEYITLQDQDILNIVFCNRTKVLPLRWNTANRLYAQNELEPSYTMQEGIEAAAAPGIIHFTDRVKPWHVKCMNPFVELYWEYRNQTMWAEDWRTKLKRKITQCVRKNIIARERSFRRQMKARILTKPVKA